MYIANSIFSRSHCFAGLRHFSRLTKVRSFAPSKRVWSLSLWMLFVCKTQFFTLYSLNRSTVHAMCARARACAHSYLYSQLCHRNHRQRYWSFHSWPIERESVCVFMYLQLIHAHMPCQYNDHFLFSFCIASFRSNISTCIHVQMTRQQLIRSIQLSKRPGGRAGVCVIM